MKNRGYTLIEMMVVTAIIGILSGVCGINMKGRAEKNAVEEAETRIVTLLKHLGEESINLGNSYELEFDFETNVINITSEEKTIKKIELPKNIKFQKKEKEYKFIRKINRNGNFNIGFSLILMNLQENKVLKKIAVDSTNKYKIFSINIYSPIGNEVKENYFKEESKFWRREYQK